MDQLPSAAEVDASWITSVLEKAGVARGRTVTSVSATSIGTGQVGENVRYALAWSTQEEDLPDSVVGKFPSTSETSLAAAAATYTYVREVGFYRDLRDRVSIRTPRPFHVAEDRSANNFVLLMEDIAPAQAGDQLAGCSVEDAALAIDAAVQLHAPTWSLAEELAALDWLDMPDRTRSLERAGLYRTLLPAFEARYQESLTAEEMEIGTWLGAHLDELDEVRADATEPESLCLLHGDYRLDNMLFGVGPAAPQLTVVDWQTPAIGYGPTDVAYFLGAGLRTGDRLAHEQTLLERYHAGLTSAGVDVGFEDVSLHYRLGSMAGYVMAVIASQIVGQTDRGDEMFVAMASRHAAQMQDVGLFALI